MTRWAPFLLGIGRPFGRFQCLGIDLRNHVLHHLHLVGGKQPLILVALQMGERVLTGAETVHQQQPHLGAAFLAQRNCLTHYEIEEIHTLADGKKALRPLQSHSGTKPAVELHNDHLPEKIRPVPRIQILRLRKITGGFDAVLGDHPRLVAQQGFVVPFEHSHRCVAHSGRSHLYFERIEVTHARILAASPANVNPEML